MKLTGEQTAIVKQIIESATFKGSSIMEVASILTKLNNIIVKHFKATNEMLTHPDDPLYKDIT